MGEGGQQLSLYDFSMCDNFSDFQVLTYVRFGQLFWRMGWSESRSQYTTMPQGRSKYRSEYLENRMVMKQVI
jgi:hypothetical protein